MKFIISAYRSEAEAFLNFSDFVADQSIHEFQVFRTERVILGISGEGKKQAERLTDLFISRYVHSEGVESSLWFNFGVAGSGSHQTGSLVYAHQVIDAETRNQWKLPYRKTGNDLAATLKTVDKPSQEYKEGVIYDMEASGILSVLSRHSLIHQVLIVKLISDGPEHPLNYVHQSDILKLLSEAGQQVHSIFVAGDSGSD